MIRVFISFIVIIMLILFFAAPSQTDIKKCVEKTGWTADRCRVESS